MTNPTLTDPLSRSAASWSARYAALKSRNVEDADPRAAECVAALAFWRLKRVIDSEVAAGNMSVWFAEAVTNGMREQAQAGIA